MQKFLSAACLALCLALAPKVYSLTEEEQYMEQFNELEKKLADSDNPREEGKRFLEAFIQDINAKYGLSLTFDQAISLIKENINQFPEEYRSYILFSVDLFTTPPPPSQKEEQFFPPEASIFVPSVPVFDSWFLISPLWSLYKSSKKHKKENKHIDFPVAQTASPEITLPDGVYVGGMEIFGGALLCVLIPVCPPVATLAAGCILDGLRRIYNAAQENPNLNESQKINSLPPPRQGGINF